MTENTSEIKRMNDLKERELEIRTAFYAAIEAIKKKEDGIAGQKKR